MVHRYLLQCYEPYKTFYQVKEAVIGDRVLHDSFYRICPNRQFHRDKKLDYWLLRFWKREKGNGMTANGYGVSLRGDKNILNLIVVIVVQLREYIKSLVVYITWMNCMVCVLSQ